MGWFDDKDDEQVDPAEARKRIPLDEAGKPDLRQYLAQKSAEPAAPKEEMGPSADHANLDVRYKRLADDNSGVDKARDEADSKNRWLDVIQGVSTMFAGKKTDGSFYNTKRAQNADKVERAEKDKQLKLSDLVTTDKLGYQGVERERAATKDSQGNQEFGWKSADEDPNHPKAVSARGLIAKSSGSSPELFKDLNYKEVLEVGKQLQAAKDSARASKADGTTFQSTNIEIPGKGVFKSTFNPKTGEYQVTEHLSGYKGSIDNTTGTIKSGSDFTGPAMPISAPDGTPMSDVRTEIEGERAYARGTASQQVKDEQAIQIAEAGQAKVVGLKDRWKKLREAAATEGPIGNTGPIGGRVAQVANKAGVSLGPKTTEAMASMKREAAQYIREMTGLTSNDGEYNRLLSATPSLASDDETFDGNFAAWEAEVAGVAERKRREAGKSASPAADVGDAPAAAEVTRRTKDGREAVFNADTKEFIRWK